MKKASGLLLLLLVGLLVAMPVAAFAVTADNGALVLTVDGTKTMIQEEVGGLFAAENMTAFAVEPNPAQAANSINMSVAVSALNAAHYYGPIFGPFGSYKPTPGAGGDGLFARFY